FMRKQLLIYFFVFLFLNIREPAMSNPFGVLEFLHWNHSWNNYKYPSRKELEQAASLMKEAGIGWVRVDFLWQDIQFSSGEFDFVKYDEIVDVLTKNKIKILGILDYTADWASSCGKWNCPPEDNKLFVKYASEVIRRYKDKVKYWEVWNEPDSAVYWAPQDNLKSYCQLLKDVYAVAKKIDPECKILNGGLANGLSSVNKLYENGAREYFDILNIHYFDSPARGGAIKSVTAYPRLAYKVMKKFGDENKKIWVTEIGCPGLPKGVQTKNWWLGGNSSEEEQAVWVKEVYTELLKDKIVEVVFWAFLRDTKEHWKDGVDYFGLARWDFSKKPAFEAYKKCFQDWEKINKL
ncbi:MAG: endo-1,4-beta-xylanase, partial [Candidatus Omnitrophota bacterium]